MELRINTGKRTLTIKGTEMAGIREFTELNISYKVGEWSVATERGEIIHSINPYIKWPNGLPGKEGK